MSAVTYTATREIHADHTVSELVNNGDFASGATGWTATGWTVGTDATHNTGNTSALTQSITVSSGLEYNVTYTISGRTAGTLTAAIGAVSGSAQSTNTTFVEPLTAAASGSVNLTFTPTTDFDGTIDDVSVQLSGSFSLGIQASQLSESRVVKKNPQISLNGTQETIFHRRDKLWNFTSTLIERAVLTSGYYYEFIESVYAGETFTFDPYGTVASADNPVSVVMVGDPGISREGQTDYFRVSFQVREI